MKLFIVSLVAFLLTIPVTIKTVSARTCDNFHWTWENCAPEFPPIELKPISDLETEEETISKSRKEQGKQVKVNCLRHIETKQKNNLIAKGN